MAWKSSFTTCYRIKKKRQLVKTIVLFYKTQKAKQKLLFGFLRFHYTDYGIFKYLCV
jgi:hypothetical protein